MGVLPLSKLPRNFDAVPIAPKPKPINWLPYIGDVQRLLETVEGTVDEFAAQRQKIGEVIRH